MVEVAEEALLRSVPFPTLKQHCDTGYETVFGQVQFIGQFPPVGQAVIVRVPPVAK